jgi:small ligand-binding sensory domain FIST
MSSSLQCAWGLSGHHDAVRASAHVIDQIKAQIGARPVAVAMVFVGETSTDTAVEMASSLAHGLGTEQIVGMSAGGVIGGRVTYERRAGLSVLVLVGDGIEARVFSASADAMPEASGPALVGAMSRLMDIGDGYRGTLVLVDSGSMPTGELLPAMGAAAGIAPVLGATALRPELAGGETLLIRGGRIVRTGLVGVSLHGPIEMRTLMAQGCRPVGQPLVVTASRKNLIMELSGRSAITVLREIAQRFAPGDRPLLAGGLYLGVAADEYRERFGRGDFVVSRIIGGDEGAGYIALEQSIATGRTVQVHLRDPSVAQADLDLLLDGQKLHGRPAGALVLADVARGRTMFGDEWTDAVGLARAFDQIPGGESASRVGYEIASTTGPVPVAGALTGGQIGPIGGTVRLQGLTASVALFRERTEAGASDSGP